MRKTYWFFLLIVLFISFPNKIKAYCNYQELSRLKEIASNINYKIDYVENNNKVEFTITLINLHPEMYIKDVANNKFYYYKDAIKDRNELVIKGYSSGKTIQYEVYNVGKQFCAEQVLLSKYVTLPAYNPFYKDAVCSDAEEYKLCQRWVKINMDYNSFKKDVENYKRLRDKSPIEEPIEEPTNNVDNILDFFIKYYIYILSTIIIVCSIIVYRLSKKDNFNLS